jgi:hypothetical protein
MLLSLQRKGEGHQELSTGIMKGVLAEEERAGMTTV